MKTALLALALAGATVVTPALAAPAPSAVVNGDGVTVPDLIYYGTCWWQFQTTPFVDPPIALGNGYRNPHILYDSDGEYFAATVEKTDAQGRVTDVILAFAAAKSTGANPLHDVTDNALLTYGGSSAEAERAVSTYADLLADPAYMNAKIHVTGLSLGSAYTQYVLGYSIATYGKAYTAQRAEFVHFGIPGYAQGIATHFGLSIADFDGLITGYNPKNDPTPNNTPPGGLQHGQPDINAKLMGTIHWLADYQPFGTSPLYAAQNGLAAHESWAYLGALGWPAWISAADKQAAIDAIVASQPPTSKYDPTYGAGGPLGQTIIGDGAVNELVGTVADDALQGRGGADVLTGNGGANSFIYSKASDSTPAAADVITDFGANDKVDLTGMGRLTGFTFVGRATPTWPGQVGYRIQGNETQVLVNNGGGSTEMLIRIAGARPLTAQNFALGGTLSAAAAYLVYQASNTTGHPFLDHALLGIPFN